MKIFVSLLIFALCQIAAAQNVVPELPNLPSSPLSQADIEGLLKKDAPEMWDAYAKTSRDTALDLAKKQLYHKQSSCQRKKRFYKRRRKYSQRKARR